MSVIIPDGKGTYSPRLGRGGGLAASLFKREELYLTISAYQFRSWVVLNLSEFSKFPAPAGEFALCRSLYSHSCVHHRALRLALLILLTFIFCWTPYYLLGLWYWFSPTMLTEVPPSLSHILFLFGLLSAPLDPLLYGAFTFGCWRGHQEHSIDSSREGGSGRVPQQEIQALRQIEVQTNVAVRNTGEKKETFLWYHLLRTAYIGTEWLFLTVMRTSYFYPCSLSFEEKEILSSVSTWP